MSLSILTNMPARSDNMNKKTKKPLSQRLCENLDIPLGTFGRISFIEAIGNREVCVDGCEGIADYTETEVSLILCDGALTLRGEELELKSFSCGRVSVSGIIRSINYGGKDGVHREN